MVTEASPETSRPYAPPSNVVAVLHRLRSRNLPDRIDAEYLRDAGVSEGTLGRTLFALRFLELIDEPGEPSQALRSMHTSTDEEYRTILSGLIREAYSEVFNVIDPAEDTQERILNIFRRYTPASQRSRMVIFFLGLCREAGIPTLDVPRQRSMQQPRVTSRGAPVTQPVSRTQRRQQPSQQVPLSSGGTGAGGGNPALMGLLWSLPAEGEPLSDERLDEWLKVVRVTLRFLYPKPSESQNKEVEGE